MCLDERYRMMVCAHIFDVFAIFPFSVSFCQNAVL
jgi:hypothetical protein